MVDYEVRRYFFWFSFKTIVVLLEFVFLIFLP
jgi:hypothetical protein